MKAIVTKYHGPTNCKGSRITASDEDGNRCTISYPYELSGEEVHRKAAQALCDKMKWSGTLVGGSLKNGYVFVFENNAAPDLLAALHNDNEVWDVWDRDDFRDDPLNYWESRDEETHEHIRLMWPELYKDIMETVESAQREAQLDAEAESVKAKAVQAMN